MRRSCSLVVLALGVSIACGGRTGAPVSTPGAEAAARITLQEYDALEKRVGDAQALDRHLTARQLTDAADAAQTLAVALGEIERFWAQNRRSDAVKWAQDARSWATQAAGAAAAGDAAKARRAAATMQGACKQCHAAYRELAAGEYRVRGLGR